MVLVLEKKLLALQSAARPTDDETACCAVFLDSSVGRALVSRMGRLTVLEDAVRRAVDAPKTATIEELVGRLENVKEKK